jgi:hypothetical protein
VSRNQSTHIRKLMSIKHIVPLEGVRGKVFNDTFSNISVTWWHAVLLMEETGVPGENHRPVASQ